MLSANPVRSRVGSGIPGDATRRWARRLACTLVIVLAAGFASLAQAQSPPPTPPPSSTPTYYATYKLDGGTATQTAQTYTATATDTSGVWVTNAGNLTLNNYTITTSGNSSSTESSSFYGLNGGVLAAQGTITMNGGSVTTTGTGANGIFAYGSGSAVTVSGVTIRASADGGHGVMASGGGSLTVTDTNITTAGGSSGAIATDQGGGTLIVTGGTVTTSGGNSPGIYSTGDIRVTGATISATGAEAAVIEGANSIALTNVAMTSSMADKWGVMIYQSMSGDASGNKGTFTMTGGSLSNTATTGPLFFVTNTTAIITLKGVAVSAGSGTFLEAGGTTRWGTTGSNGGTVNLTADGETLTGNMVTDDTISSIAGTLQNATMLNGAVNSANLTIDSTSAWNVTAASALTGLTSAGTISGTGAVTAATTTLQSGIISAVLAGTGSLTKTTTGTATLAGANTYTGATTVSGGTLNLTGSLASSGVTVGSGATLGGTGTISGSLSVASGASLVLNPSGHISVGGNLSFGGTVTVVPASGLWGGTYTLLSYGGTLSGSPAFVYSGPSGQTATFSTSTSGKVTVTIGSTALMITSTSTLADGTVGTSYSQTFAASGGTGPYTWSVVSGSLPGGLSLSAAGLLSGTPTASGDFSFTVKVTDSASAAVQGAFTLHVSTCTSPSITSQPQSQSIQSGQTATLSVTATGTATLSYQWYQGSSGDTSHPVGTNASSFITPALTATTSYWVRVSNSCGQGDSTTATVTVVSAPALDVWVPVAQSILTDVVGQLGGSGSGPIEILSDQPLKVTARTYNQVSSGASCYAGGTQGQDYPAVVASDGLVAGQSAYLAGLTENASYRCNIGLVNVGSDAATVLVELFDAVGTVLGGYPVSLAAGQWAQGVQLFKNVAGQTAMDRGYAKITVQTGTGVFGFASVVDNITNDPTTVTMKR